MSELKPCPFCGSVPDIEPIEDCEYINCSNLVCIDGIYCLTTKQWNTRPIEDELRAEIARRDEIIARLKEALPTFKRGHYYCDDCWYSCPKAEDGCCDEGAGEDCNCGADEWNARIDLLMKELK